MICTDCQRITMTSVTKDNLVSNQDWETHTYEEHISIPSIVKENCVYLGISQILICPPFYEHSEFWDVILNIIRIMFTEELPQTICARVSTSQVPQPTCYWKWVGVTMPLKAGNFSLQPSRRDNSGRAWPVGCLLDF